MEVLDLQSKTKDELIEIIQNLCNSKELYTEEEFGNKRKRATNALTNAGRDASFPIEIISHHIKNTPVSTAPRAYQIPLDEDHLRLAHVVVEEMYQFCALLDSDGNVLIANTPALTGAGIKLDDIVGRPLWNARWWQVSPEHQAKCRTAIKEVQAGNFVRFETSCYGCRDGLDTIWIDFNLTAIYDRSNNGLYFVLEVNLVGKLKYMLAEGRNISDKKKAEEAIERKNEVCCCQEAAYVQELRQLYQKVTELDELKSQFFANVSHELRTPLTLILGPVQRMLAEGTLPQRDLKDLEVVKRNTQTLLKHVNDLLDVSKMEAKKLEMNVERIDLEKLLNLVCSNFEVLATERKLQFKVSCTNSINNLGNFVVELDSDKMQRVILNLLSNAFKFTPTGGKIHVQLLVEQKEAKHVVKLTVSDSGQGVPENLRKLIFERFRQGEGSSNRKFGGTGLGLAIAKEFVEMHKGTIHVEESEFRGAKFVVELPMTMADMEVAEEQAPVKVSQSMTANTIADLTGHIMTTDKVENISNNTLMASQPTPMLVDANFPSNRPTILIVEDNVDMGNFISDCLSTDYQIMRAYNGVQALEVISQRRPDIILSDVMMPYMSGDVMVRHIRSQKEMDNVPIILLTAKADDNLKLHSLKGGVQDFLNKPFSTEELQARVDNLVSVKLAIEAIQKDLESKDKDLIELTNQLVSKRRELQKMLDLAEKSRTEAERLNIVKDQFLMTLSHELRTPLTGIIGWVSLIKDEIASDNMDLNEVKKALEIIEQCSDAETKIITSILDLSDIVAGKIKLARNPINIGQVIDTALDSLTVAACAKNITIRKYDTPNCHSELILLGDFERLTQVAYHLVSNSVKFTPNGGRIEIGAEYSSEVHINPSATLALSQNTGTIDGTAVIIRVKDDGVGIPQENLAKLFSKFGQLDSSSTRTYSGLGLGLALCRHIVELHGGFITVESTAPVKGTVVSVYLPLVAATSLTTPLDQPKTKQAQSNRSSKILHGKKLLLVEPEKPNQLLIDTIFRREGAILESTAGTAQALTAVNISGIPKLVIVNVDKVLVKDSLWLIKSLRSMKSSVQFLGLVSEHQTCELLELTKEGMDFLRKPFKSSDIISSAVAILSRYG